jgi:hypothetical protein
MSKVHLVLPDPHAHPDYNNDRADWVGQLIKDIKPDVVINMGDAADLPSLSSFDKGKASFHGRNYEKDINSHLDFQDRMWAPMKKSKKKQPLRVVLEGNHEHRIKRVLESDPHLEGGKFGVSFKDLAFDDYYHEVVEYQGQTPGIYTCDGIDYAHYFISGVMGRPVGGEHHAASLINPKTLPLVLLLTLIQLIGLFVLIRTGRRLWVSYVEFTKTTRARGLGESTTSGGGEWSSRGE